ncbi:MAG: 5-oxoprolinase subunit PxpA [Christensenellaceae bacterium]|nr:5-oxoprolinase subunit PxpA [Christensenellaceae bacterium]
MSRLKVDLNCDMGESFGPYTIGCDATVAGYITSANVACGFHASDPLVMDKTVAICKANGVAVGGHPGYPDLVGFGRRNIDVSAVEVKAYVQYQTGAIWAFCKAHNVKLQHIKPHGAMYNMAGKDHKLAYAICEGIASIDSNIILLGLSGSAMLVAAKEVGLRSAKEVFADRAYEDDGSLVARSKPGAMITNEDEAIERVISMIKNRKVKTVTGKEITMIADSVCVHGDGQKALAFVTKIRDALTKSGIDLDNLAGVIE